MSAPYALGVGDQPRTWRVVCDRAAQPASALASFRSQAEGIDLGGNSSSFSPATIAV